MVRGDSCRNLAIYLVLLSAALSIRPAAAEIFPSKVLSGVSIDDRGHPAEGARLEAALKHLQRSATVRRMEARRRKLGPLVISFAALDTSTEPFSGSHGHTEVNRDSAQVQLNEVLYISTAAFIETLAHELYGHGVILRESARLGLDLGHTIDNEAFSLAIGAVSALELGDPIGDEARVDALTLSTSAYADEVLFTDSPSRIDFSINEARNPRAAITARQKELARRRLSLSQRRKEILVWRWQIEHFEKVHRTGPQIFKALRASLDNDDVLSSSRRALLDKAEPHLKEVAAWLDEPDGRTFATGMVAASTSPYILSVDVELAALGRRIGELKAKRRSSPAPSISPAAKQAGWGDLIGLGLRDRAENPDHWKGAPETSTAALPWLAK